RHGCDGTRNDAARTFRNTGHTNARGRGADLRQPDADLCRVEHGGQYAGAPPDLIGGGPGGAGGWVSGAVAGAGDRAAGDIESWGRLRTAGPGLSRGAAGEHGRGRGGGCSGDDAGAATSSAGSGEGGDGGCSGAAGGALSGREVQPAGRGAAGGAAAAASGLRDLYLRLDGRAEGSAEHAPGISESAVVDAGGLWVGRHASGVAEDPIQL